MSVKPTNIPKCHLRKSADSAGNISRHCKLGELTENIRTFALPFESRTYTFKMQYEYDSWNRIQRMIYPDGLLSRSGGEKGLRGGGAGKPRCSSRGRPGFRGTLWVASRVPSAFRPPIPNVGLLLRR